MYQNQNLGSNPSLKQLVYDNLRDLIIQGKLEPGAKLVEDELAQSMNISRAPVREALNMLERDGFTKIIPRKGAVVTEVNRKDAADIWKCRSALEPFAAREAMPNIPQNELEEALEHTIEIEKNPYIFEKYVASDLEVHGLYYKYLDNEYMKSILNNLKVHSVRVRWLREAQNSDPEHSLTSTREHERILRAFLSRDGQLVFDTVQAHIESSAQRLNETLK